MPISSRDYPPFRTRETFTHKGVTRLVFKDGRGPGVLLMHELPGMILEFWRLAHWIRDAGFTVWAPDLYASGPKPSVPGLIRNTARLCVSRQIHLFASNHSSPITQWLRALGRALHEANSGTGPRGIGVIGLCLTGNFAWTLAVDPWVTAPVASEPSLPIALGAHSKGAAALHMSRREREALAAREVDVMALRFEGDPVCRAARFDTLRDLIGPDRLHEHVLPDTAQNPEGGRFPHAVLTKDLIDREGEPTKEKVAEVIRFLRERLPPSPTV